MRAGLDAASSAGGPSPFLVVNADLPCVTPRGPARARRRGPRARACGRPASDGTTNALGLSDESHFEPLYGPGSAERFVALSGSRVLDSPNLVDDVDTVDDLARLGSRVGPRTRSVLAAIRREAAA